jgi:hypothetical protein
MQFNDLLRMGGIDPKQVNVMLHSPQHPEFAKVLPTLVHTRRDALDMYQATHNRPAEQALKKGRPFVAVFVRVGHRRQVFVGIYDNLGWRDRPWGEILAEPEAQFLFQTYGVFAEDKQKDPGQMQAFFNLLLGPILKEMIGRLVVEVDLTQTYVRLAESLETKAKVLTIMEEGAAETPPPEWRDMTVTAAFLEAIPSGWANRLAQWRGIYLIVDESDGKRYVGSAYGAENLLGRWLAHTKRDVGVTVQLRLRNPINFRFSILERVSPDMPADDVITLEQTWMTRLHTRTHGLN